MIIGKHVFLMCKWTAHLAASAIQGDSLEEGSALRATSQQKNGSLSIGLQGLQEKCLQSKSATANLLINTSSHFAHKSQVGEVL